MKMKRTLSLILILAMLVPLLLPSGGISIVANAAVTANEIETFVSTATGFLASDYDKLNSYLATCEEKGWTTNEVPSLERLKAAVLALGGMDFYDDFKNIGTYLGQSATDPETGIVYGIEPENAGQMFPTEINETNYEILYSGIKAQKYTEANCPAEIDPTLGYASTWPYVLSSAADNMGTHHVRSYWYEGAEQNKTQLHGDGAGSCPTDYYEDTLHLYNNWFVLKDSVLGGAQELPVFSLTIENKGTYPRIIYNWIDINNYNYLELEGGYTHLYEVEIKDGVKTRKNIGASGYDIGVATDWAESPWPAVTLKFIWNSLKNCYVLNVINANNTSKVYSLDLVPTSHPAAMVDNVRFSMRANEGQARLNLFNKFRGLSFTTSIPRYLESRINTEVPGVTEVERLDLAAMETLYAEVEAFGEEIMKQVSNLKKLTDSIEKARQLQEEYESEFSMDQLLTFEDGSALEWKDYFTPNSKFFIVKNPYENDPGNPSEKVLQLRDTPAVIMNNLAGSIYSVTGKFAGSTSFYIREGESYVRFSLVTKYGEKDADGKEIDAICLEYAAYKDGERVTGEFDIYDRCGMEKDTKIAAQWIDFAIRRVGGKMELEYGFTATDGKYYCNTTVLSVTNTVQFGTLEMQGNGYVDDLKITAMETDPYYAADVFLTTNDYILGLYPFDKYMSQADQEEYNILVDSYQSLTDLVKQVLGPVVMKKAELAIAGFSQIDPGSAAVDAAAIADAKNNYQENEADYAKLYETFTTTENDDFLTQWQMAFANSGRADVVKNEALGRNVLRIRSNFAMVLSGKFMPEQANISEISYYAEPVGHKLTPTPHYSAPDSSYSHPSISVYTYYKDINNYQCYWFYEKEAILMTVINGERRRSMGVDYAYAGTGLFDPQEGMAVRIVYQDNKAKLTLTDAAGEIIQVEQAVSGDAKNIPVFGAYSTEETHLRNHSDYYCDFRDIKIKFSKGDWDEDVVQTDLNVSYTGNTYQSPGDLAVIRGENLGNLVSNMKILQVANQTAPALGYVDRTAYDYAGVEDGEFTLAPSDPTWNWTEAQEVKIIRKSADSLQFVIPEDLGHGIYALQLNAVVNGEPKSRIVYLNAPVIDFYLGSDGGRAAPGTDLEIVGENLAPNQNTNTSAVAYELRIKDRTLKDVRVKLIKHDDPAVSYDLKVKEITSDYNIVATLPSEIAVAADGTTTDWELYVYNGYGDSTCWSVPQLIQIGRPLSELRPTYSVNILDYGITGTYHEDATAAMQQALTDLHNLGGGTLYMPEGHYRLSYTVYVPENITIQGEGKALTNILPTFINFVYGELPAATGLVVSSNCTIDGVGFYLKRARRVISATELAENVTINDVKFYTNYTSWANNSLGQGGNLVDRHEMYKYNESTNEDNAFLWGTYINLKFTDILAELNVNGLSLMNCYSPVCNYGRFEDIIYDSGTDVGWTRGLFNNGVWKNCLLSHCNATQGRGVYMYNCTFGPHPGYNRELWVADLAGDPNTRYQILPDETGTIDNSVYLAMVGNSNASGLQWMVDQQVQLYIISGNGAGQTAEIVGIDTERNCLVMAEPFQVPINRNSIITTRAPREDIYFVDCTFYEGSCPGGFFGGCADVIHDGDHMNYTFNQYYRAREGDVNWYCSMVNSVWENTPYSLIAAYGMSRGYTYSFVDDGSNLDNSQLGITIRNNRMDNMMLSNSAYSSGKQKDFIVDNNVFDGLEYIMESTNYRAGVPDGLTFYRNTGDKLVGYTGGDINPKGTNNLGYTYITYLDEKGEAKDYLLGDVNMDGVISLKDVTVVHYAVAEMINLTDIQLVLADVNGDGAITAVDATYIRNYILSLISKFPAEPEEPPEGSEGDGADDDQFSPGWH